MFFPLFLIQILNQAHAGYQDLSSNLWLNWTFTANSSIFFEVGVDSSIYSASKWVGIGLKDAYGDVNMMNAEIITFYMSSLNNCQSRYSSAASGMPSLDPNTGYICSDQIVEGSTYIYGWERKLNNGDNLDMILTENQRVMIIWAQGPMSGGDISYHGSGDSQRGHQIVFLQENYNNGLSFAGIVWAGLGILYVA